MTEENTDDDEGDDVLLYQHKPSWRSVKLNKFISLLDKRENKRSKKRLMRERVESTHSSSIAPSNAPSWAVRASSPPECDTAPSITPTQDPDASTGIIDQTATGHRKSMLDNVIETNRTGGVHGTPLVTEVNNGTRGVCETPLATHGANLTRVVHRILPSTNETDRTSGVHGTPHTNHENNRTKGVHGVPTVTRETNRARGTHVTPPATKVTDQMESSRTSGATTILTPVCQNAVMAPVKMLNLISDDYSSTSDDEEWNMDS